MPTEPDRPNAPVQTVSWPDPGDNEVRSWRVLLVPRGRNAFEPESLDLSDRVPKGAPLPRRGGMP